MSAPLIHLDGSLTPRQLAKRTRRSVLRWLAFSVAALALGMLRTAIDAGVL